MSEMKQIKAKGGSPLKSIKPEYPYLVKYSATGQPLMDIPESLEDAELLRPAKAWAEVMNEQY